MAPIDSVANGMIDGSTDKDKISMPLSENTIDHVNSTPIAAPITPPLANQNLRIIKPTEYKAAALTLAEAFKDDAVARYMIDTPDQSHWTESQKWQLHLSLMECITLAHCHSGLAMTVGEDYGAVALWLPPKKTYSTLTILRSGLWRLPFKLSAESRKRFMVEFIPLMEKTKALLLGDRDEDSWYLVYLGTKSSARGKGYARKLVDHVTKLADETAKPCYLESSNTVNVGIYRRMGFEVARSIYLQRAVVNVALDVMIREPKVIERIAEVDAGGPREQGENGFVKA